MKHFSYRAFNSEGRLQKGQIDALDLLDARRKLKARGLSVADLDILEASPPRSGARLRALLRAKFDQTRFFGDLSVLMNAGLGIDQALRALYEASGRSADKEIIGHIIERLASGAMPSAAFSGINGLPEESLALVASGERSARLPYVMKVITADLQRRDLQRKQIVDALVYPLFLLVMMFVAVGIVTFVLVPTLEPIFESSGRALPWIVALLSGLRRALSEPSIIVTLFAGLGVLASIAILRPSFFREWFGAILLKLPLIGGALRQSALGRYLQSLSLLLENAVPLPEALALAARSCPAQSYREPLLSMREQVISGKRLPEAFATIGLFPRGVVSLVAIGDEVNRLSAVLDNAAGILRADAQRSTDRMLVLLTPAITIFLGLLVGGLVTSVMTALLSINELSAQ